MVAGLLLWREASANSVGESTHLAMVAGLLLWREASAKVFILLSSGGWGPGQFIIDVCADDSWCLVAGQLVVGGQLVDEVTGRSR
jgi:hypothetical protein